MRIARTLTVAFGLSLALATLSVAQQPPQAPPAPPAPPKPELKVVGVEAVHALVLPMKGSYMQHPDAFDRVMAETRQRGIAPAGAMFARYFSNPDTAEADLAWEVGIPVAASVVKAEAPFEIRDVPAATVATQMFRGPMEELEAAWPAFVGQVLSSGYQIDGPPMQIFSSEASGLEMRLPVTK